MPSNSVDFLSIHDDTTGMSSVHANSTSLGDETAVDIRAGLQYGTGAYLLTLFIAVVAAQLTWPDSLSGLASLGGEGWLLTQFYIHDLGLSSDGLFDVNLLAWTAITAVVLVGAGYLSARETTGGPEQGGAIAIGYLLCASVALAAIYTQVTPPLVEMILAFLVVGILYPLVLGGVGGLLARRPA